MHYTHALSVFMFLFAEQTERKGVHNTDVLMVWLVVKQVPPPPYLIL